MVTRASDAEVYKKKYGMEHVDFIRHTWYRHGNSVLATMMRSSVPAISAFLVSFLCSFFRRFGLKITNVYKEYDVILDLNTDSLNEHYGLVYPLFTLFELLLVLLCDKKVIVCPSSIGPFKNAFLRQLARFVLDRIDLIMVREESSQYYLEALGISKSKIRLTADLAFLVEPISCEDAKSLLKKEGLDTIERPLVGIAPSQIMHHYASSGVFSDTGQKYKTYIKLMAEISDFVIEDFGSFVIFVPHSVDFLDSSKNDRITCARIYSMMKNRQRAMLVQGDYRTDEIKGIIRLCDMFIGCRMHSAIASTSSGVPTAMLAYGQKFHGVLGRVMGQTDFIVSVTSDFDTVSRMLKQKIKCLWANKDSIKGDLQRRARIAQARAQSSALLIKQVMECENSNRINSATERV
jgi:polysaccharide pyruvyl transferase WcaK-like protein